MFILLNKDSLSTTITLLYCSLRIYQQLNVSNKVMRENNFQLMLKVNFELLAEEVCLRLYLCYFNGSKKKHENKQQNRFLFK